MYPINSLELSVRIAILVSQSKVGIVSLRQHYTRQDEQLYRVNGLFNVATGKYRGNKLPHDFLDASLKMVVMHQEQIVLLRVLTMLVSTAVLRAMYRPLALVG